MNAKRQVSARTRGDGGGRGGPATPHLFLLVECRVGEEAGALIFPGGRLGGAAPLPWAAGAASPRPPW